MVEPKEKQIYGHLRCLLFVINRCICHQSEIDIVVDEFSSTYKLNLLFFFLGLPDVDISTLRITCGQIKG